MRKRLVWFVVLIAAVGLLATGSVASAKQTTVTLTARLSGAQEVPAADPDGSGKAFVMIDVEAGEVCFDIKSLSDVGTPNRGHIHEGVAGANGGIVVPFFELRIPPADPVPRPPIHATMRSRRAPAGLRAGRTGGARADRRESGRLLRERPQRAIPRRRPALPARDVAHALTA